MQTDHNGQHRFPSILHLLCVRPLVHKFANRSWCLRPQSHNSTLTFQSAAASSYYMGSLDPALKAKLEDSAFNISIENHEFGLPVEHYDKWPVLKEHYKILTTAKDRCGVCRNDPLFSSWDVKRISVASIFFCAELYVQTSIFVCARYRHAETCGSTCFISLFKVHRPRKQ